MKHTPIIKKRQIAEFLDAILKEIASRDIEAKEITASTYMVDDAEFQLTIKTVDGDTHIYKLI